MNLSELRSAVRDNVQDPNALRWSDSVITSHLNTAQSKLAQMGSGVDAWMISVTASPPPGDPTFVDGITRPPQLLAPTKILFRVGEDQWQLDMSHGIPEDPATVTGYPQTAYFAAGTIYLRPYPSVDGVLVVSGTSRVTPMSTNTDIPTLEDADDILIAYATWMCLASDGDPASRLWYDIYQEKRQEWAVLEAQKNPTNNRILRDY